MSRHEPKPGEVTQAHIAVWALCVLTIITIVLGVSTGTVDRAFFERAPVHYGNTPP